MISEQEIAWVKALKCGSRQAFNHLYELYADKVYFVSCRMHMQQEDAQEIVQEVFLTLWEQRASLNENLSLNAYLLTITRNKILTYQRKKAAQLFREISWQKNQPACSKNTEDGLLFKDMENHTLRFIENLSPRKKEIFLLSRRKGLSNDEIADHLNLSKRTVENNLYQAEKAIYQFLQHSKFIIQSLVLLLSKWLF